jgi:hypothetical protein
MSWMAVPSDALATTAVRLVKRSARVTVSRVVVSRICMSARPARSNSPWYRPASPCSSTPVRVVTAPTIWSEPVGLPASTRLIHGGSDAGNRPPSSVEWGSARSVGSAVRYKVAVLYSAIGVFHWLCRRPFFLISTDPAAAYREGWRVRWWDFLFYASFGVVVTSSVRIAGVLLVFSYLIVPALAGIILGGRIGARLMIGWAFGTLVSVAAMVASATLDLPTGATVVCAFGLALLALGLCIGFTGRPLRVLGPGALAPSSDAVTRVRQERG